MTSSRGATADAPRCASSKFQPMNSDPRDFEPSRLTTPPALARPSTASPNVHDATPSTSRTWGTRSTMARGARAVHRSWGSVRWVSASTTLMPAISIDPPAAAVDVCICSPPGFARARLEHRSEGAKRPGGCHYVGGSPDGGPGPVQTERGAHGRGHGAAGRHRGDQAAQGPVLQGPRPQGLGHVGRRVHAPTRT